MLLTTLLIALKILTVFVEPASSLEKDDQTLATCVVRAMTARPSELTIAKTKELADATLVVANRTGFRVHVTGKLTRKDGTTLIEVNHVTRGLNHSLCHQVDGLLDEMAKKLSERKNSAG